MDPSSSSFPEKTHSRNNDETTSSSTTVTLADTQQQQNDDESQNYYTFPEEILEYDHYQGVTIHWNDPTFLQHQQQSLLVQKQTMLDWFVQTLQHQLSVWRSKKMRGVWLHVDADQAEFIPMAIQQGFQFHMVSHHHEQQKTLILSTWLPTHTPSRLPNPPSHQIGVGCLVWHPEDSDDDRRMLVVQEKTGPAASFKLWKMPTGLADPAEDIPQAAIRELYEETGLEATFDGMVAFRQAHTTPTTTGSGTNNKKWGGISRKASDLFFVCQLSLVKKKKNTTASNAKIDNDNYEDDDDSTDLQQWTACPQEIADIQWMKVSEYCKQERWQVSPLYQQFNQVIRHAAQYHLWTYQTLPLRKDDPHGYTNTLYFSKTKAESQSLPTTTASEHVDNESSGSKL